MNFGQFQMPIWPKQHAKPNKHVVLAVVSVLYAVLLWYLYHSHKPSYPIWTIKSASGNILQAIEKWIIQAQNPIPKTCTTKDACIYKVYKCKYLVGQPLGVSSETWVMFSFGCLFDGCTMPLWCFMLLTDSVSHILKYKFRCVNFNMDRIWYGCVTYIKRGTLQDPY